MAVEQWQVQLVAEAAQRATDIGERASRQALQEAAGLGAGDLDAVLDVMLASGTLREDVPGEYALATAAVSAPAEEPAAAASPDAAPVQEAQTRPREGAAPRRAPAPAVERETVLSRAMVESLDPAALGALVLAGVQGEDGAFVLRVEP